MKYSKKNNELIDLIFERQYYTNHGPELQKLENDLETSANNYNYLGLSNYTISFLIAILAINNEGKILIPSILDAEIKQAVDFKKLNYRICDVNSKYGLININYDQLEDIETIIINNTLGFSLNLEEIVKKISPKVNLIILSKYGFGIDTKPLLNSNILICEIFDCKFYKNYDQSYGSIIRINNSKIAERIRNIRSSYGSREKVNIPYTGNGRMSEIQAGLINIALNDFKEDQLNSKHQYNLLMDFFKTNKKIEGIEFINNGHVESLYNNFIFKVIKYTNEFENIMMKYEEFISPISKLDIVADDKDINAIDFIKNKYVLNVDKFLSKKHIKKFINDFSL